MKYEEEKEFNFYLVYFVYLTYLLQYQLDLVEDIVAEGDIVVAVMAVAVDMVVVFMEAEEVLLEDIMNQENLMLAI